MPFGGNRPALIPAMPKLAFKYQIALGPALIVMILIGLIWFSLDQFGEIRAQNETIRKWGRITDRLHIAIGSGQRMLSIAEQLSIPERNDAEDLQFTYLEQSRIFSDNVLYPECVDKMPDNVRGDIAFAEQAVRYDDNLDAAHVSHVLHDLLPQLDKLYENWWVLKRAAYSDYYDNLQVINNRLLTVSLSVLVICVLLAGATTLWTVYVLNRRLRALSSAASAVCDGRAQDMPVPANKRDEIDQLSICIAQMTRRLVNWASVEKVLEGGEAERKRIAMDMHDQTLADLTAVRRRIESLARDPGAQDELNDIAASLGESVDGIRDIIDDLHPRILDILGLEAALESYLKRKIPDGKPEYYLSIDTQAVNGISDFHLLNYYRIALEAINNALRHARCSRLEIDLRLSGGQIVFSIEDNGRGFDESAAREGHGHGLANMRERAKTLDAVIEWRKSRFSSGTRVELRRALASKTENLNND